MVRCQTGIKWIATEYQQYKVTHSMQKMKWKTDHHQIERGPAPLRCATSGAKLFQLHNSWYLIALRDSGNAEGWKRLSFCSRCWCRAGSAVHWGDVRSPVHAALQHHDADDEVTNNNSAIKPTCRFKANIDIFCDLAGIMSSFISVSSLVAGCEVWCALSNLQPRHRATWCGAQTSESRHRLHESRGGAGVAKNVREEREETGSRADSLGRVSHPGPGGGEGTADCRHCSNNDINYDVCIYRHFKINIDELYVYG